MPRQRQRACLQDGLKLDLNRLSRQGLVARGKKTGPCAVRWTCGGSGEEIARGLISADMEGPVERSLRIQLGGLNQWINLIALPRHLGGHQWYFECPKTGHRASVLWMPPGASRFASRHAWPRQVAYRSQFVTADDRAHLGKAKIKSRLIGSLDPNKWDLPPKPKWMRWATYNRYVERCDAYDAILDEGTFELVAKLMGRA
jgi:hypothetical protein